MDSETNHCNFKIYEKKKIAFYYVILDKGFIACKYLFILLFKIFNHSVDIEDSP